MKSHTGYNMTMGQGSVIAGCIKQKINTKSSTEAELVAADDTMNKLLWSKQFMEEQGYDVTVTLMQDNTSAIQLENNGKASSSKRTRHLNICFFFITDQIERKQLEVKYCPTDQMQADYFTKPKQGVAFEDTRKEIMGIE